MGGFRAWVGFVCFTAVAAPACAVEVGGPDEGAIGEVAQALGGFTQLALPDPTTRPLHVGPTFTVFSRDVLTGSQPIVMFTATGALRSVHPPATGFLTAAGSDDTVAVAVRHPQVVDAAQIYVLDGDVSGSGSVSWRAVGGVLTTPVAKIVMSRGLVFYQNKGGIRSVPQAGGATSPWVNSGSGTTYTLLGHDGSALYMQVATSGRPFRLVRQPKAAASLIELAERGSEFAQVSFDANHVYWVENGATSSIRRVSKLGGAVEKVVGGEHRTYHAPVADGSSIWFVQEDAGPVRRLRRMNLSNNSFNSVAFPFPPVSELLRTSSGLYLAPLVAPNQYGLYRTPL